MPVQSIGKRGEPADSGPGEGDGRRDGDRGDGRHDRARDGDRRNGGRDDDRQDRARDGDRRSRDSDCRARDDDRRARDDPPVPLHVVPERVSLDGLLSAALDTLDLYLRRARWHAVMVGYDTAGTLRFARDLGPVEARRPAGVSVAELRRRGVAGWYLVSFGLFRFESGDVQIPHPTLSAAAIAVELGRGGDATGDGSGRTGSGARSGAGVATPNYCIGQLGFVRPTGFVPTTLRLLSITTAGPQWGYTMLNELPI